MVVAVSKEPVGLLADGQIADVRLPEPASTTALGRAHVERLGFRPDVDAGNFDAQRQRGVFGNFEVEADSEP